MMTNLPYPALTDAIKALASGATALAIAAKQLEGLLKEQVEQNKWMPIASAVERIGGISPKWILARIRDGRYEHGVHYVNVSDGDRPNYLVSVAAIRSEMNKTPEERKADAG